MKRSEMIELINEFLEKNGKPDYLGERILATRFLSFIESQGMQPPPVLYDSNLFGQLRYNEWEDEE
jgi:hypothetical protein